MKSVSTILASLTMGILIGAGIFRIVHRQEHPPAHPEEPVGRDSRAVKFYQSPMHPWIRSDKPGRCTICGMELVAVHEGEAGPTDDPNRVVLGTNAIQVLHLGSVPVEPRPVLRRLRLGGVVDDNDLRHRVVASPVDARIERLGVRFLGQEFASEELLAEIFSPTLLAAEREYVSLRSSRAGEPLVAAARQRLLQWGILPAQIDALPSKDPARFLSEIRTSVGGTVVSKRVYEGQYVKEGEVLFETADLSTMWGQFDAYESDLPWIQPGVPVVVRTPSVPGREFVGKVDLVDPTLNPMSRSARIRVELPNPLVESGKGRQRLLFHRVTATAEIQAVREGLSLPRSAVLRSGGPSIVFVDLGGGAYERREVRVGVVGDERIQILGGVQEGERVVSQGGFLLDAQTQLNRADLGGIAVEAKTDSPVDAEPLKGDLESLLQRIAEIAAALASEDPSRANRILPEYQRYRESVSSDQNRATMIREAVKALPELPVGSPPRDLEALRRWQVGLGVASGRLLAAIRKAGMSSAAFRLIQCPMTGKAFEGAPRKGYWIQVGTEVRNPYFGAAMVDCGTESVEVP